MHSSNHFNISDHYNPAWVAGYFDSLGIKEWERLTATPVDEVSLHVHAHYLERYLPRDSRVLEIGAGAGRFTKELARLTDKIVVGDLSPGQLTLNKKHAAQYGFAHAVEGWYEADICDLSVFASETFDAIVAYGGPLSYVMDRRMLALGECARLLKPDGILLASVMSVWGGARHRLNGVMRIPVDQNKRVIETGDITAGSFDGANHFHHMYRSSEFSSLLTQAGLEVLALSASSCLSIGWGALLAEIRDDLTKWEALLCMEVEACAEPGAVDMGPHIIGVARKSE